MNMSKLIWGIACLVIAAGLTVANLTLPPENLMFQIGEQNMPWIPPVVLAIVGVVLLATANRTTPQAEKPEIVIDPQRTALNQRLEGIAWGCFLIMLGGFMFVPHEIIRGGWWSIGVGLIMLGLNAARYANGLRMSGFSTGLGLIAVSGGVFTLFGLPDADGALLLIILGAYLLGKPWFEKRQLFGKAEEAHS